MKYRSLLNLAFLFLIFASISPAVDAQQPIIKDRSEIVGAWKLVKTAQKKDGSVSNKEASTWDFRPDGTVVISGYNKFIKNDTTFKKDYKVAGDVVEVTNNVGTTKYSVIKKTGDEMILKGPYGYHFFEKK